MVWGFWTRMELSLACDGFLLFVVLKPGVRSYYALYMRISFVGCIIRVGVGLNYSAARFAAAVLFRWTISRVI